MAPPSEKNPRKRTWDHEKDLYDFLLDKIRVLNTQKKKLNYFNNLLHRFLINDPKADSDLIKFTDGPYSIVQSQLFHLQDKNSYNNNNNDEENLIEYEEERIRFLLNHMKRHGKSYVLEIVEDGVYLKYGDESSCAKKKGKVGVKKSKGGRRRNVKTNRVVSKKGGRGRKLKGATKLSAAKKRGINNKKSDVASEAHKNAGKRKRGRPRKILEKNYVNEEEGVSAVKSACIDESVKKEIQDDDDGDDDDDDDDVIGIINVKSSDNEVNPRKVTEFREKLMEEINRPYCEEEHKRLSREINARTPVQKHRDLRGSSKTYTGDHDGKSFLDHHLDLLKELEAARDDFPKVLRLLRGFFFWLKHSTQEGEFMPWRDPSCLDELPQQ